MAQAARDRYSYRSTAVSYGTSAPERKPETTRRPYKVIEGEGRSSERAAKLSDFAVHSFKTVIAVVAILAVVCSLRVFLSVSTVQVLEASASLQTQIEEARATGNDLEIRHSVLANPTSVQKKAAKLGMSAPKTTERLIVALPAETKTFENGKISVSATIKSIQYSAGAAK